jgi:hypothetical protein
MNNDLRTKTQLGRSQLEDFQVSLNTESGSSKAGSTHVLSELKLHFSDKLLFKKLYKYRTGEVMSELKSRMQRWSTVELSACGRALPGRASGLWQRPGRTCCFRGCGDAWLGLALANDSCRRR